MTSRECLPRSGARMSLAASPARNVSGSPACTSRMASGWLEKTYVRPPTRRSVNHSGQRRAHASRVCNGRNAKRSDWIRRGAAGPGGSGGPAASVREEASWSWKRSALIETSFGPCSGGSAREQAVVDDLLEDGQELGVRNVLLERQHAAAHEEHVGGALGVDVAE